MRAASYVKKTARKSRRTYKKIQTLIIKNVKKNCIYDVLTLLFFSLLEKCFLLRARAFFSTLESEKKICFLFPTHNTEMRSSLLFLLLPRLNKQSSSSFPTTKKKLLKKQNKHEKRGKKNCFYL